MLQNSTLNRHSVCFSYTRPRCLYLLVEPREAFDVHRHEARLACNPAEGRWPELGLLPCHVFCCALPIFNPRRTQPHGESSLQPSRGGILKARSSSLSYILLRAPDVSPASPPGFYRYEAINVAMGNNPPVPYSYCVDAHAGFDADVVSWEMVSLLCIPSNCTQLARCSDFGILELLIFLSTTPSAKVPDLARCGHEHTRIVNAFAPSPALELRAQTPFSPSITPVGD